MSAALRELYAHEGDLISTLCDYFRCRRSFTNAYVKYFERSQCVVLRTPRDLKELTPTQEMWFHYALSTNARGADLLAAIERIRPVCGRRYLDIGCGFGGCLVAAGLRRAQCVGIEMDTERVAFAQANIGDFGLGSLVHLFYQDALDPTIAQKLGQFDVISCNDVAEHVDNVEQLFANLGSLLRPGGFVYMEVPNRYSIDFVRSDGHFGLFGITLLERPEAQQYHWQKYHYPYDVGHYLTSEHYEALFERFGMQPQMIPCLYHPVHELDSARQRLSRLDVARKAFEAEICLPASVHAGVLDTYRNYRNQLERDLDEAERLGVSAENDFRRRYLCDFWTFLGFKESAG